MGSRNSGREAAAEAVSAAGSGPAERQAGQAGIDASIRADHPSAPYVTYEPTPYDAGVSDNPEIGWREVQAEAIP